MGLVLADATQRRTGSAYCRPVAASGTSAGAAIPRSGSTVVEALTAWALGFLDQHAEWAIFLVLLLEEAGIPLPLPGDVVVVLAGARVRQGRLSPVLAVLLLEGATLLGSSVLYWLARRGGRPLLYRYGEVLHLGPERLAKAEGFLQRHGWLAIVSGRLCPGLRILISLVAGAFAVPYRVFAPALALGASVYLLVLFGLGYVVGPEVLRVIEGPGLSLQFVEVVAGSLVVGAAYVAIRRRAHQTSAAHVLPERFRLEIGVMAGLLASAATALVLNVLLSGLSLLHQIVPTTMLDELARALGPHFGTRPAVELLIAIVALYVAEQVLWAVVYAHAERWLPEPDWLGGLVFAVLPLAVSLWIVLPALGAGLAGVNLGQGWTVLIGECVRYAIYGWSLSTTYTLLSRARLAPGRGLRPVRERHADNRPER
jgi:membrane-associated protein